MNIPLSNDQLAVAWRKKLPGIEPQGREMTTFAIGVEVGVDLMSQGWNRLHHLLKKYGWHPGRTDDDIIDILDARIAAIEQKNKRIAELEPKRVVLMRECDDANRARRDCEGDLLRATARIAELEAELASVLSDWNGIVKASGSPTNGGAIGFVRAMKFEHDALRADAERYRFLRGDVPEHSSRWSRWRIEHWAPSATWNDCRGDDLDAAIDAAKGE